MGGRRPISSGRDVVAVAAIVAIVGTAGCAEPAAVPGSSTSTSTSPIERPTATASAADPEPQADAVAPSAPQPTSASPSMGDVALWSVVSIVDGDTLEVSGAEGVMTVRLIGVNAPEEGECLADEAAAALRELAAGPVMLVPDETNADRYGRALRYVETPAGVDVGGELVRRGLAVSRRYEPDTARNDAYHALQADAVAAGVGTWAPDACGPAADEVSIEVDVRYDAAGDDNENLNDEWVRFTNTGGSVVDLDGWTVADESASHRYTFRSLALAPAASVTLRTGCGTDTETERFWCNTGSAVWNNAGDTVFLRDPRGNNVMVHPYDA